jgi:hypothetical protein
MRTGPAPAFAPPGFTSSAGPDQGWTTYASEEEGFSISLPPGWEVFVEDLAPKLMFAARESDPGQVKFSDGNFPFLQVIRVPASGHEIPSLHSDALRRMLSDNKEVDSEVLVEPGYFPAGKAYVLRYTVTSDFGWTSVTMYSWLRRTSEYRLVIAVPLDRQNEYSGLPDSIAKTFLP